MPQYEVSFSFHANSSGTYRGEHDTVQQAIEAAENTELACPSLCHQCTDALELGDLDGAQVYLNGECVYDDTYAGTLAASIGKLHAELATVTRTYEEHLIQTGGLKTELATLGQQHADALKLIEQLKSDLSLRDAAHLTAMDDHMRMANVVAAMQAENDRLRAELDAANRELDERPV